MDFLVRKRKNDKNLRRSPDISGYPPESHTVKKLGRAVSGVRRVGLNISIVTFLSPGGLPFIPTRAELAWCTFTTLPAFWPMKLVLTLNMPGG